MAGLVLDASAALAILLPDENPSGFHALRQILRDNGPAIWHVKMGNAFLVQRRRNRLLPDSAAAALEQFPTLAIEVDLETIGLGWRNGLRLAERYHLTLSDAVYLELEQRRSLPLATLDRELRAAALVEGVPLANPDV